jgi:hypothetical protein
LMQTVHLLAKFLLPSWVKWTPSFSDYARNLSKRAVVFEVGAQVVVQHESITLKFFKPIPTSCLISTPLSVMKSESSLCP